MPSTTEPSIDEILSTRGASPAGNVAKAFASPVSWNAAERSAVFVMSAQTEDRYRDIVVTEGIDLTNFMQNPVALMAHASRDWSIGQWSDLQKKALQRGPRLEGKLTLDTGDDGEDPDDAMKVARTAARKIEKGQLRACSIGFVPMQREWIKIKDEKSGEETYTGGIRFLASDLLECSVCNVPAHPSAMIRDAAGDVDLLKRDLERAIDEHMRIFEDFGVKREDYLAALRAFQPMKTIAIPAAPKKAAPRTGDEERRLPANGDPMSTDPELPVGAVAVEYEQGSPLKDMSEAESASFIDAFCKLFGIKRTKPAVVAEKPDTAPVMAAPGEIAAVRAEADALLRDLKEQKLV